MHVPINVKSPNNISEWQMGFNSAFKGLIYYLLTYLLSYSLTPWSRVLSEKLTGLQLVNKFLHFIEPEVSLPHSQVPAACPYPEPSRPSPYPHIPLPEDPF